MLCQRPGTSPSTIHLSLDLLLRLMVPQEVSLQAKVFAWSVATAGAAALGYAFYRLAIEPIRLDWILLLIVMALVTWRAEVRLPGIKSKITLTDTIIFITALLINPWAATTLAAIDGLARSLRNADN